MEIDVPEDDVMLEIKNGSRKIFVLKRNLKAIAMYGLYKAMEDNNEKVAATAQSLVNSL